MKPSEDSGDTVHAIKTLATLVALQHYKGKKTGPECLAHCAEAVEAICAAFASTIGVGDIASGGPSGAVLTDLAHAAELLGLNLRRKPRAMNDAERERFYKSAR